MTERMELHATIEREKGGKIAVATKIECNTDKDIALYAYLVAHICVTFAKTLANESHSTLLHSIKPAMEIIAETAIVIVGKTERGETVNTYIQTGG